MVFEKLKKGISEAFSGSEDPEYIEIDLGREMKRAKVIVRPFVLKSFEDITPILNALREGYTIAIIDINADADRDKIYLVDLSANLAQYPAHFFISQKNIVRPFKVTLNAGNMFYRLHNRQRY